MMATMEKPKKQLDKFREAARELETDDDEGRFDEKLKRIAKANSDRVGELSVKHSSKDSTDNHPKGEKD